MLLVVLLLVSKAACVGGPKELRTDEVLVMCPLSEDARMSRRSVVISHSNKSLDQSSQDTMMGCVWLERDAHDPLCRSHFHFTLVSLQKDYVTARVPRAQLHKDGFYQCQLVPPLDEEHDLNRCLVYDNDDTEDHSTTISPVIASTADDLRHPQADTEKVSASTDGGSPRGISAVDVILIVLMVILIMLIVGLFAYIFLLQRTYGQNVQRAPEIPQDLEQQLRRIAQRLSEIVQAMEQQSSGTVPRTSETSLEKKQQPLILQGNGAKDSRYLPGDGQAVSALNHSNSFKGNGATDCRELPGDGGAANKWNHYNIEKDNGATDCIELPGDEEAASDFVINDYRIEKKNGVTDVRDIPGDEDAANVWNHSNRFKRNGVTDIRDLRGDGEPMYGITPTGLRRTESQTPENSLDMYMDMLSIYGTTPTALSTIAQHEAEINLETAQQSRRTVPMTSEPSLEKEQQPLMSATPDRGRSRERHSPKELTGEQPDGRCPSQPT